MVRLMDKPRPAVRPSDLSLFPESEKTRRCWTCWRFEIADGAWAKVPYNVRTGRRASHSNPDTWSHYEQAVRAYKQGGYDGLQVAISAGRVGVDLDHCGDVRSGHIEPWARGIIDTLNSYSEWTPSGTGIRIFCMGTLPERDRKNGNVEMYDQLRFLTVTGRHIMGTPLLVEARTEALAAVHAEFLARAHPEARRNVGTGRSYVTDPEVLQLALKASNGVKFGRLYAGDTQDYMGDESKADLALCSMLAWWCNGDATQVDRLFRNSGLYRPKWDSRRPAGTYGAMTIEHACEGLGEGYDPARILNTAPRRRIAHAQS